MVNIYFYFPFYYGKYLVLLSFLRYVLKIQNSISPQNYDSRFLPSRRQECDADAFNVLPTGLVIENSIHLWCWVGEVWIPHLLSNLIIYWVFLSGVLKVQY